MATFEVAGPRVAFAVGPGGKVFQVEGGAGVGAALRGVVSKTVEPLTLVYDPVSPNAIDPPPGVMMNTQAAFDAFLSDNNATAFLTPEGIHESLPELIDNPVLMTQDGQGVPNTRILNKPLAATLNDGAFNFVGKLFTERGTITIRGEQTAANWPEFVAGTFTVTANSGANTGAPFIEDSGAAFVVDALKGKWVDIGGAQKVQIVSNTATRCSLQSDLSPVPVDGVTPFRVVTHATVWENSLDGATAFVGSGDTVVAVSSPGRTAIGDAYIFEDIQVNDFGASSAWFCENSESDVTRVTIDHTAGPLAENGFGFAFRNATYRLDQCGVIATPGSAADDPLRTFGIAEGSLINFFTLGGATSKPWDMNSEGIHTIFTATLDGHGLSMSQGEYNFSAFSTFLGRDTRIKSVTAGDGGIVMKQTARISDVGTGQFVFLEDCIGVPCVKLKPGARLPEERIEFRDGGGNTDVGIELEDGQILANLSSGNNVTGGGGNDVRLEDGSILAYGAVGTRSPYAPTFTAAFSILSVG